MKKILATLLASAMTLTAFGGLVACGGSTEPTQKLGGSMDELIVWAPESSHGSEGVDGYKSMIAGFKEQYPQYKDVKITFQAQPEGEVETKLATDPAAGADVFFFENGQTNNMLGKNLLQPLVGDLSKYADAIKARDGEATWKGVTNSNGQVMAFPATNDNGWFLWYNKDFFTTDDVKSLDTMLAKAKTDGKKIMFNYGDGWYMPSFWQGAGNIMDFEVAANGSKTYVTDIDNAKGKEVAKTLATMFKTYASGSDATLIKPSSDMNSEIPNGMRAGSVVAGFIGTWVQNGGERSFYNNGDTKIPTDVKPDWLSDGEWAILTEKGAKDEDGQWKVNKNGNIVDEEGNEVKAPIAGMPEFAVPTACPTFKVGENDVQMGTFYGGKYCGVNPRRVNKACAAAFADWMTNENGQLVRYTKTKAGPTNKNLLETNATIKNDKALSALSQQISLGGYSQQSQASKFWDSMAAFGNALATKDCTVEATLNTELDNLCRAMRLG